MMSASHASRLTVAGGSGWPSHVSHTLASWRPVRSVSRSTSTSSSAGRRAPGIGVDVTIAPTETSVFNENFWSANFQAMSNYFTYDIIDPDEIVGFSVLSEASDAFQTGWVNPEAQ